MARITRYHADMTKGALLPQLLLFAFPLMLTSVLQLLYNAADVAVVGRFAGSESQAAVGSTTALIHLIINLFIGLSLGGNVVIAHAHGAGDAQRIHRAVHTSISLALISGVAVMGLGLVASRPMLQLMDCPDEVIDLATLYMTIFFLGMPFNMLYNFGAGILRAVGDTKHPLLYLSVSGLVNVVLNLVLVINFHMGVAGVAIATVASQVLSAVFVLVFLMRTHGTIRFEPSRLCLDLGCVKEILRVGIPAGLQSALFSISNVLVQTAINSHGAIAMAGNTASSNIEGFTNVAMNSISQGTLTFASANRGAKQYKRVRRVLAVSLAAVAAAGICGCSLVLIFRTQLLGLFNSDPKVIEIGVLRMICNLPVYFIFGMMDTTASQLRGMGYSIMPMLVSLTGICLTRIIWLYTVYAANPTLQTLYVAYPLSWALTLAAHLICYFFVARPKMMQLERELQAA